MRMGRMKSLCSLKVERDRAIAPLRVAVILSIGETFTRGAARRWGS